MSWQEREGLRREVRPYVLPDRALVTPSIPMLTGQEPHPTIWDEWSTGRLAVQPVALLSNVFASQWPLAPDPISETAAGTYYTNYVNLVDGPTATGLFSCPECTIEADDAVTVYIELVDEDDDMVEAKVASLTTDGEAIRTGASDILFSLTAGTLLVKARFRVVASGAVEFSTTGQLTSYGSL